MSGRACPSSRLVHDFPRSVWPFLHSAYCIVCLMFSKLQELPFQSKLILLSVSSGFKKAINQCINCGSTTNISPKCLDSGQEMVPLFFSVLAGLVITTPQGTLVPTASTQSFVAGHPTCTTMIVSAVHPSNAGRDQSLFTHDSRVFWYFSNEYKHSLSTFTCYSIL